MSDVESELSRIMRLLSSLLLFLAFSPRLTAQTLTITNATVVNVADGTLHPGTTVTINGKRIVRVEPSSIPRQPRGRVIDATGMYIIPGLWDMHTHAYFGWSRDFGDSYVLPLFIANGVTGIRDMGSDLRDQPVAFLQVHNQVRFRDPRVDFRQASNVLRIVYRNEFYV